MVATYLDDDLPSDRGPRRDVDVAHIGRRIATHRWWLIGPTLGCFLVSALVVNVIPPRYTADTKLLLENQESYFTRGDRVDPQPAPLPDDEAVQSQVQLVTSRDLARSAIRDLKLQGNSEFDPLAKGLGPITRTLILLGLEEDPTRVAPEERMLGKFSDRLTVFPVNKSRVLTIEFESEDADLAARAANTVADLYIDLQGTAKREAAKAAADTLRPLIASLRSKAAEAEAKAQAFRTQSGLVLGPNNSTITSQQLADMSTQLAQAQSTEADAQAKAKLIRDMVKSGRTADIPDVVNNDLIRRLSEQRASVLGDIALQSRTLLPGHPRMQALNAQLGDLDRQLKAAADKAARGLDSDANVAASRVENLKAAMNTQKAAIGAAGGDQVKLNDLDLNARLLKDQLELNTTKYQEALARESAVETPADARVISRAVAPQLPSFPKKLPIILIATIAGALLSLGMLIAREFLSGRAYAIDDEAEDLPIAVRAVRSDGAEPVVASAAPDVEKPWNPAEHPATAAALEDEPAMRPTFAPEFVGAAAHRESVERLNQDGLSEDGPTDAKLAAVEPVAARSAPVAAHAEASSPDDGSAQAFATALGAVLARKHPDQALRVLVSSADPTHSPAALAVRLGRALSRTSRAILVDCYEPTAGTTVETVQQKVGFSSRIVSGFSELIDGRASFAEVIHRDAASRLHFITGMLTEAQRVRDEDGVAILLDALAETYDFVICSGPAMADTAPTLLGDHTDLVVVEKAGTPGVAERVKAAFANPEKGGPDVVVTYASEAPATPTVAEANEAA